MDCVTSNAGSGQPLTNQRPQGYSPLSACGPLWWFPYGVLFIFGFCAGPAFARTCIAVSHETLDEAPGVGMGRQRMKKDKADETSISALPDCPEAPSWFPLSQGHRWRPQHSSRAAV